MKLPIKRRDLFRFAGGLAVGTAVSPLPWKILDDVSIWSQNDGFTPLLSRGPVSSTYSHCALCPAACGIQIHKVGGVPYGVTGAEDHPTSLGALCALGSVGHHIAAKLHTSNEARMSTGGSTKTISVKESVSTAGKWLANAVKSKGKVAFLDSSPDTAVSVGIRKWLHKVPGAFQLRAATEDTPWRVFEQVMLKNAGALTPDIQGAKVIFNFGAPLAEGWGSQAGLRYAGSKDVFFIQAESRPSPTALGADLWLRTPPGSEEALALALANAVGSNIAKTLEDAGVHPGFARAFADSAAAHPPAEVEKALGLPKGMIGEAAKQLKKGPSVVLADSGRSFGGLNPGAYLSTMALNFLVADQKSPGGMAVRARDTSPFENDDTLATSLMPFQVEAGSISLLMVDETRPVPPITGGLRKLLSDDAKIIRFSSRTGGSTSGWDLQIPVAGANNTHLEITSPVDSPRAVLGISKPMNDEEIPSSLLQTLSAVSGAAKLSAPSFMKEDDPEKALITARLEKVVKAARGTLWRPGKKVKNISEVKSGDALWKELVRGGLWIDDEGLPKPAPVEPVPEDEAAAAPGETDQGEPPQEETAAPIPAPIPLPKMFTVSHKGLAFAETTVEKDELHVVPYYRRALDGDYDSPALFTKLYVETHLVSGGDELTMSRDTAAAFGVSAGGKISLSGKTEERTFTVRIDDAATLMTAHASLGPAPGNSVALLLEPTDDITRCAAIRAKGVPR